MTDFSHLKAIGDRMRIKMICDGERLGDYELLKAVKYFNPPLLSPEDIKIIHRELDGYCPRTRGRPSGGVAERKEVAGRLERVSRADVPQEFLSAIATRLRSGKRFPLSLRDRKAYRQSIAARDRMIMQGLYRDIKEAMIMGESKIQYRELESFEFPKKFESHPLYRRALKTVNHIMHERLNLHPPA